jgi:hypothetical protein
MVFYLCELCNFETQKKTAYTTHCSRNKHLKNLEKQNESNIKCNRCNFTFLNEDQLTSHKERNSLYFTNHMFKHRKCNDFSCSLCNLQFSDVKILKQHQTNCSGVSKFAGNIKQKTIDKNKKKFEDIKQHFIETQRTPASIKINNTIKTIVKENKEEEDIEEEEDLVYPEEDYYHDYEFIDEHEWEVQQPDPTSKFYNRFFEKETIKYKNKTYIIDRLFNCYNKNNEIIGGFVDI